MAAFNQDSLLILKSLKKMEPICSIGFQRHFFAFRVISFKTENQVYPTIELLDDGDGGYLLYHEMSSELSNNITLLLQPHGKYGPYLTYYVPDNISTIEKALAFIMPELAGYTITVEISKYGGYTFKTDEAVTAKILEPLKMLTPDELFMVDSDISNWFFEIEDMWKNPKCRQNAKLSFAESNRVEMVYRKYDIARETILHSAAIEAVKKRKATEEVRQKRLQEENEKKKLRQKQARVEQEAKIQRAGADGEKKVEYVLDCMGPDTIRIKANTVSKFGKSCIMLKSEKWASIPQEYDHILIRENGVFLIETKNLSGTIEIDQFGNWFQTKEGFEQGQVKNAIESPTFQVYRHEKLVRSFLPTDIPVISMICLANPHVLVQGQENCKVPVLRWDLLAQFVEDYSSDKKMSREEMEAVCNQIKAHYYEHPSKNDGAEEC